MGWGKQNENVIVIGDDIGNGQKLCGKESVAQPLSFLSVCGKKKCARVRKKAGLVGSAMALGKRT